MLEGSFSEGEQSKGAVPSATGRRGHRLLPPKLSPAQGLARRLWLWG